MSGMMKRFLPRRRNSSSTSNSVRAETPVRSRHPITPGHAVGARSCGASCRQFLCALPRTCT